MEREAREAVRQGSAGGTIEVLAGYDQATGKVFRPVSGDAERVTLSDEMRVVVCDPAGEAVLTHNHPASTSFSRRDMLNLASLPGLRRIEVLGTDGSIYSAEIIRRFSAEEYDAVLLGVREAASHAVKRFLIDRDDIARLFQHAVNEALAALGYVTYSAELNGGMRQRYIACRDRLRLVIEQACERLRK